jgi:hypothetical protein
MAYQPRNTGIRDGGGTPARDHSRQRLTMMIGGGLILLLIGLGLIASATLSASTQEKLRAEGKSIVADVVDTQVTKSTRRGTVTSTRYEVKYRFQPPGQTAITSGWEEAPEAVVRAATQAKTIEVSYLPGDPSVNLPAASISGESGSGVTSIWQMIVGAAFVITGLAIMFLVGKGASAPRRSADSPMMSHSA